MVALVCFGRSPGDFPPVEIPRNSLPLRILRITPFVTVICAEFSSISMKLRNLGERGEGYIGTDREHP